MKRPPGIWMLLSAGVLWLSLQDVYGIRATALIFAKSTTTTPSGPVANATDIEVVTESSSESGNVTKTPLTGNPQIDYLLDPNLPKELNGYNLSSYPFYERVPDPEEIDFKCDGLHDGFYASIPYKCQVYHHCLFGTRYDFLCANYTAFDQKTFICQFVSDVDCVGSKKFWHRNDALYEAATTTTSKPLNIYTTAPPSNQETAPKGARGGGGKRRRPIQRRPQFDYYEYDDEYDDEYYDDRPRSRRRRPRPRPRPIYDDEYDEEYEDESYERRNRRPYNRRGGDRRRNKNRNKNRDEPEVDERPNRKKVDEENRNRDEDERKVEDKKKPNNRDEEFDEYDSRPTRPRKGQRRPIEDDYDEIPSKNRPNRKKNAENEEKSALVKPTTGTIYDRPRVAPRIKPPVPKNEANKYAYKPVTKSTASSFDDDYYDDYDEVKNKKIEADPIKPKSSENKERKQAANSRTKTKLDDEDDALTLTQKTKIPRNKIRNRTQFRPLEDPDVEEKPKKNNEKRSKPTTTTTTTEKIVETKLDEEYYDYEIEKTPSSTEPARRKASSTTTQKPRTTTTIRTTTTAPPPNYKEPIVRIVKRPFLPSRGGNPYNSRGLQPVGLKATEVMEQQSSVQQTSENLYKPTTTTTRHSSRSKFEPQDEKPKVNYEEDEDAEFEPQTRGAPRQKPQQNRETVRNENEGLRSKQNRQNSRPRITEHTESKAQNHEDEIEPSRLNFESQTRQNGQKFVEQNYEETKSSRSKLEPQTRLEEKLAEPQNRGATRANLKYEKPLEATKQTKFSDPITDDDVDDFKPMNRPYHILRPNYDVVSGYNGPRTTQKPKILEKNPLDINENEYDVTLNDALNPTLPNLPIGSNNFGNGFNAANDYTFSAFQRPRYVLTSDNAYQNKQPVVRQRYETAYNSRDQYVAPSSDYNNFYAAGSGAKRGPVATSSYYTTSY